VLYLDTDTIVLDSAAPLWDVELGDRPVAAASNPVYPFMNFHPDAALGLTNAEEYFNSGVLLLDLERMRREGSTKLLLEYAQAHPWNQYPDQDALNVVFAGRRLSLHPRWNAPQTLWHLSLPELPFTSAEVQEARSNPAIVHFVGPFKPWHYLCTHPYKDRYFEHLAATPWPAPAIEGRTALNRALRRLPPNELYLWQARLARLSPRRR
jgi:lipopolysaccharide biosynthesis glycosyltransferase